MSKRLLFWNAGSGKSEQIETLRQQIGTDGTVWHELSSELDLALEIAAAVANNCETVIAAGGDGTVNAIVNALMTVDESQRPQLGIIPLGTANDFAGTLKIPDDISAAVAAIDASPSLPIDVVRISGHGFERYYANVAAGGNCVRVSEALTDEVKSRWGALSYMRGAVEILPDMRTYRIAAECDAERLEEVESWAVLVANGKSNAGRIEVAPQASPIDGLLDVILIRDGNAIDMIEIVANNLFGNYLNCDQIIFRQVKKLTLQSTPPMRFTLDGEIVDEEPVEFESVAGAIRMFVGPDFERQSPRACNPSLS